MFLFALILWGCAPEIPPPCTAMCSDAAVLYGGCLEDWGLDWFAAGYDDERAFLESCDTWAWEVQQINGRDAPWLRNTCVDRRDAFSAPDAVCDDYTSIDWNDIGGNPQ